MIAWEKKFEIGHQRIDFEHQIFLGLILEFRKLAEEGCSSDKLYRTLNEVLKYAEFHFLSEENIMLDCGYPQYARHAELHAVLLSKLRLNMGDLKMGRLTNQAMFEFLFDWFVLHTTHEDIKITQYLSGNVAKNSD